MAVPGSNLLNRAFRLIAKQQFVYLRYIGNVVNEAGYQVPQYADPVTMMGSVQAVNRTLLKELGLDLSRNYLTVFACYDFHDVERDTSSDRIQYAFRTWQIESTTPWYMQDGWKELLLTEVVK